jgi:hypothetical protein
MLAGMTEYRVTLWELRKLIGEVVVSAAYGDARYVISRYGKEIAFVGGPADLQITRDWDNRMLAQKAKELASPPPPPDPLDELRQMHSQLAMEIGDKLMREAKAKA